MKYWILACALLFTPVTLNAQDVANKYELTMVGATTTTYGFLSTQVQCNQTTEPGTGTNINPRWLVWNDPVNTGRICYHDTGNSTGVLFALPIGDYTASLVAINASATAELRSDPSNSASFSRLVKPAARTGFRVRGV